MLCARALEEVLCARALEEVLWARALEEVLCAQVLEEMLDEFKGCLLVCSHDRAFMDGTVDQLLVLRGDGIVRLFDGSYSDYLQMLEDEKQQVQLGRHTLCRGFIPSRSFTRKQPPP